MHDVKCVRLRLERLESGSDILRSPDFEWRDVEGKRASRGLYGARLQRSFGIANIFHDCQPAETRDNLAQKFEFLGRKIACLNRQPGGVAARSGQTRDETAADRIRLHREHDWND